MNTFNENIPMHQIKTTESLLVLKMHHHIVYSYSINLDNHKNKKAKFIKTKSYF